MENFDNIVLKTSLEDITQKPKSQFKKELSAEERIKTQKREYFTLLTAQLKNQDPFSPLDTSEMTAQIFAINHVEQQLEGNRLLEEIKRGLFANQWSAYMNYIGKQIDYPGNKVRIDASNSSFSYQISEAMKDAVLKIRDMSGRVVHTESVNPGVGLHSFNWNKPNHLQNGMYIFEVKATRNDDTDVMAKTYGTGAVSSLVHRDGRILLEVDGALVNMEDVGRVRNEAAIGNELLGKIKDQLDDIATRVSAPQIKLDSLIPPVMGETSPLNNPQVLDAIKKQLAQKF